MTDGLVRGLQIVRRVAERVDPTAAVAVGVLARATGLSLSRTSRLCTALERTGLLERGESYGTYLLGGTALRLSGAAFAPVTVAVQQALLTAGQRTGETVLLAAPAGETLVVTAAVPSGWTLHSPSEVGEVVADTACAAWRAVHGQDADVDPLHIESTTGRSVEVATPVRTPSGERVAALAVRLPANRAEAGVPAARRALDAARRVVERAVAAGDGARRPAGPSLASGGAAPTALEAGIAILRHLAAGADTVVGVARATGLRRDRAQRLLTACRAAGVVQGGEERDVYRLSWGVQGWHRAAAVPLLVARGTPLVAASARRTGVCAFITVLSGMRSVTLVEMLESVGEGLRMTPWLGRPCPIMGADGGPTLLMDLATADIAPLLPRRTTARDRDEFLQRVRDVVRDGVLAKESFEEAGQVAISAPIRDASGAVVAAACLVGATDEIRPRLGELREAARALAADVDAAVRGRPHPAAG